MSGRRVRDADDSERKPRGILYYIGVGLSGGLLAFVLLIAALVIVVPAATGSTPMTVLTSSMEPTYPPGTLVIVRPTAVEDIRIGDALTYQIESGKPEVVTHRVISISSSTETGTTFITQGDNNDAPDSLPVIEDQIRGTVWYSVPWIGYVNTLVNGDYRSWIVPSIAIVLFLYAGYMLASGIASAVRKRRESAAADADAERDEMSVKASEAEPATVTVVDSASDISHVR